MRNPRIREKNSSFPSIQTTYFFTAATTRKIAAGTCWFTHDGIKRNISKVTDRGMRLPELQLPPVRPHTKALELGGRALRENVLAEGGVGSTDT